MWRLSPSASHPSERVKPASAATWPRPRRCSGNTPISATASTPMFTTIEGDLREIFECIIRMHDAVAAMGAGRISSVIKVDDRRDKVVTMEEKVQSVMQRLE